MEAPNRPWYTSITHVNARCGFYRSSLFIGFVVRTRSPDQQADWAAQASWGAEPAARHGPDGPHPVSGRDSTTLRR
ncbi:hypothetical protein FRAHR75_730003 [Frankia sp. Hr75.2]|nr:hypothetical protein FRAHR75_730003 [Frankia sp. Hr75.2]